MGDDLDYAAEKAVNTLSGLVRHPSADLRDRINDVWVDQLIHARVRGGLEPDTQALFDRVHRRLTQRERLDDEAGRLRNTLNHMDDNEVSQVISAIVQLCIAIIVQHRGGHPSEFLPGYLAE